MLKLSQPNYRPTPTQNYPPFRSQVQAFKIYAERKFLRLKTVFLSSNVTVNGLKLHSTLLSPRTSKRFTQSFVQWYLQF